HPGFAGTVRNLPLPRWSGCRMRPGRRAASTRPAVTHRRRTIGRRTGQNCHPPVCTDAGALHAVPMVNLTPAEPRPTDDDFRPWLLRRLDLMRSLVESGAPCMIADSTFSAHDDRPVMVAAFHFFEDEWIAMHRERQATPEGAPACVVLAPLIPPV